MNAPASVNAGDDLGLVDAGGPTWLLGVARCWPGATGYGAGRVTTTGVTHYLPHVPPGLLQAVVSSPQQVSQFQRLGALTLIRKLDSHDPFTEDDVRATEGFAEDAAQSFDAALLVTVTSEPPTPAARVRGSVSWRPQRPRVATVSTEGQNWARRTVAQVLTRTPWRGLYDDLGLVFPELITNAVRHGGGLREAWVANTGAHLRLVAADNDPRSPVLRLRRTDRPNGRGMHLLQVLADRWGVCRHHAEVGKRVWADLRFG